MWKFCGSIKYTCDNCGESSNIPIDDFSVECVGGSERQMGAENLHELIYEFDCLKCNQNILLSFEASEYPVECLNFVINKSTGAETIGEPEIEYLEELYSVDDLLAF